MTYDPYSYLRCCKCGERPLPEHRRVYGMPNGEIKITCNDHVEVQMLSEPRPRYLPAVPTQSGRHYVEWDEDLAAIGVIEPVFMEEERVEMVPANLHAHLCSSFCPPYTKDHHVEDLVARERIVTVPVLRWQKVTEPEGRVFRSTPSSVEIRPIRTDWYVFVAFILTAIFGPLIALLLF